ncbi:unnamed protein product [Candidula unifasciata]|uniref:Uncharacterized protein n=1 Tax=Candidula unifasciata TaxID=100452 RepID=A0A8S3ZY38_9EUPU|nr:unnamed protein product [Candidula unifasciata]
MNIIVKAHLQREDGTVEVRRIPIALTGQDNNNGIFRDIASKVGNVFPSLENKRFTLKWKVDGMKENGPEDFVDIMSDQGQDVDEGEGSAGESKKDDACDGGESFPGFMRRHFRQSPPCSEFGNPMEFWDRMGGHHMGMSGAFGGPGLFEGPSPFHFDHHFGHHFGHHHGKGRHGKRHHGKDGWKGNLRDAVPVAHRRWAKSYIRTWRVQNLKNATSTSSDSEQDAFALDTSNVPEAYMLWLETLLPKWHRRIGEETSDVKKDEAVDSATKDQLKASVPVEFRKWAKWYLSRHFGKKESPRFRKHGSDHDFGMKLATGCKKNWKRACKMQTLSVSVPMMHRMWAKIFIKDWRQEHNIPDPKSGNHGAVSSESEDTEKETAKGDITIPNDYVRWMRKFLARWHLWRGETTEKVQIEKGGMGEFKDTVPKNFRKWVKCFLWRRYGSGVAKEVDTANQYQKWLQAFQHKWLRDQEKGSSADELVLSSSDEDAPKPTSDVDTAEKLVESSLKKLRLEGDENGTRNVHFDPSTQGVARERMPRRDNSAFGDFEGALFNKKTNPGFRQWAFEALWQWDGKTASSTEGAASNEQIPPHVYHVMSRMMAKMQMKKMKQELKQAKQAMKAAKKAQK